MILECGAADLVDVLEHRRYVVLESQHRPHDVESASQRSFGARTVVADDVYDERVFAEIHLLKCINDSAYLRIYMLQKARKDLLHPRVKSFLVW